MSVRRKVVGLFLLCALLVLAVAPAVFAQSFTPLIYAIDQDVVDGNVTVVRVTSSGPGWIVVEADDNGAPGEVLGYVAVPNGISANIDVPATVPAGTTLLHVMLHQDLGTEGVFEWPGVDEPAMVKGNMIMSTINVGEVGSSLLAVAQENGFSTLLEAATAVDLADELAGGGPYTVFAPTDDAFAALPAGTLDSLLETPEALSEILLYHIVPGVMDSSTLTESVMAPTLQGEDLDIQVGADGVTVNGAHVTSADLKAYNGVIHAVDTVLLPPSIVAAQAVAAAEAAEAAAAEEAAAEAAAAEEAAAEATAAVTETVEVTPTEVVTETAEVAPAEAVTETAEVAPAEAVTETAEVAPAEAVTETAEVAPAEVVTESAVVTEAAETVEAAPETLPTTGNAALPSLNVLAAGFVLLLLVAAAFVSRRRTA